MNRTKVYIAIIITLIFSILFYLFYVRFDVIIGYIAEVIDDYSEKEIIIPTSVINNKLYHFDTVKQTNSFIPYSKNDVRNIYYTVLNNGWDKFTFYCPDEYITCSEDVKALANESDFITTINNYVSPYNSYSKYNTLIIGQNEILLTVDKLYTNSEILLINEEIERIITELEIDRTDVKQKDIKKIHDYLIKTVTYDEEYEEGDIVTTSNKANGALIEKVALCSGYTDAFALFMDKLGIKNFKVSTDNHVWNVIYFNDQWLHVDVTWDDDETNNKTAYYFFLIDTEDLLDKDKTDHSFNQDIFLFCLLFD